MATAVYAVMAALVCAAASVSGRSWDNVDGYTFEQYVKDFGKRYVAGSAEWTGRSALFGAAVDKVRRHNADVSSSYKLGINKFSDWTDAEKGRLRGQRVGRRAGSGGPAATHVVRSEVSPPRAVDYRARDPAILTAVKDQGDCGSCWAHGTTQSIETYVAMATGQLFVLSQQEVTSCDRRSSGCDGGNGETAFDYVREKQQLAQEWSYPYTSYEVGRGRTPKCKTGPIERKPIKMEGYTRVASNNETAMVDALARVGPLAVVVAASTWPEYHSGIFDNCNYELDHLVQLVGYGETNGQAYWIIRNSWSASWGEMGYMRLKRDVGKMRCGSFQNEKVCGACGVAFDPLYPIISP